MIEGEKKCVGVIFGGKSNEHDISIFSAKTVFKAFNSKYNKNRFKVKFFYIDKEGNWFDNEKSVNKILEENPKGALNVSEIPNHDKFNFLDRIDFQEVDTWFPLLHGFNGEDGAIHGLLKFTQKPLIGSGILGSAIGMDKILMKKIFSHLKIPQVNYLAIQNQELEDNHIKEKISTEIIKRLNFPIFIKPSNSGSSLGISKVNNKSEISNALEKAYKIDSRILVEEGLEVRELECGIIGKSKLTTSLVGEISYSNEWYDYESKYSINNKTTIPAEIDPKIAKQVQKLAIQSCRALDIYGFARVDFFLEKNSNNLFLNEINTIPGFTSKSMFPMLWNASGLDINQLVAKLVEISLKM